MDSTASKVNATRCWPDPRLPAPCMRPGTAREMATVNDARPTLPAPSDAVHSTAVVPMGKVLPDAGEHDAPGEPETASLADTLYVTARPSGDVACWFISC